MNGDFRRGQREDQPSTARIDSARFENVSDKSADTFGLFAV